MLELWEICSVRVSSARFFANPPSGRRSERR